MARIDEAKIRRLDGTLLLVFQELLRRRSATAAGERLGLSQSGVSHALGRLREVFDDPLFLRRPRGLEPTRRALDLAPRVEALLALARQAVTEDAYDPASSTREFNVGSSDNLIPLLARTLFRAIETESPSASVSFRFIVGDHAVAALRRGEIDVAVGAYAGTPEGTVSEVLASDRFVMVARRGHRLLRGGIDAEAFRRARHVAVAPAGSGSDLIAPQLADRGLHRKVMAVVPRYMTGFAVIGWTDAVMVAPGGLAAYYREAFDLETAPLPGPPINTEVHILQRANAPRDAAIDWLIAKLRAAATAED